MAEWATAAAISYNKSAMSAAYPSIASVGRDLLLEAVERLRADGHEVRITDPDGLLDR